MEQSGSNVNPVALVFLLTMSLVILVSNRRNAVGALLVTAAFIPLGQQVSILGLHFYFVRILILAGLGRLLLRREGAAFKMLRIDKLFLGWVFSAVICGLLRGPKAELFGQAYDAIGIYFLFRILMRDAEEVLSQLRLLACIGVAVGVCMAWEWITHHNPFSILGGVQEFTQQREGRFRCEGPFRHPILAGTFGATLFPLLVGLWLQAGDSKRLALGGCLGCAITAIVAASSGAVLTLIVAIIGFGLWPMRERMRILRRGMVVGIIALALVMKAPVWYLISRISDLVGGSGWHRSYLIDQFIGHFNEWWLIGTGYTAHWAPGGQVLTVDPNNMDITNHYVMQGLHGGILTLSLFVAVIVCGFKVIGQWARGPVPSALDPRLVWAFGVALASHCAAFISISYFDQINVFWFWLLAAISVLSVPRSQVAPFEVLSGAASGLTAGRVESVPMFR